MAPETLAAHQTGGRLSRVRVLLGRPISKSGPKSPLICPLLCARLATPPARNIQELIDLNLFGENPATTG